MTTEPDPFTGPLSPYLTFAGGSAAIDFYRAAFAAQELFRQPSLDGSRVFPASLLINGALMYVSDASPEMNDGVHRDPRSLRGTTVTIHLRIPEGIDEARARAIAAGAHGCRAAGTPGMGRPFTGVLRDPLGHCWSMVEPSLLQS